MNANPSKANELMTDNIREYLNILADNENERKSEITDKGKILLEYLQTRTDVKTWKAKDLAEAMGISSRSVSGSLRSLATRGFCEKLADNPSVYTLTEKGKNYTIIKEENIDD